MVKYGNNFEVLRRVVLASDADSIVADNLPFCNELFIILSVKRSGSTNSLLRFNNDSGTNYSRRVSNNGGVDTTLASATNINTGGGSSVSAISLMIGLIKNNPTQEKIVECHTVGSGAVGAANTPGRVETVGKWANATQPITRIDVVNDDTGEYLAGTELLVLGLRYPTI